MAISLLFLLCWLPVVFSAQGGRRLSQRRSYPVNRRQPFYQPRAPRHPQPIESVKSQPVKRAAEPLIKQTEKTKKFAVNGTAIPDVDFDVGESYAGLLPISKKANETSSLYFWFFPTDNPAGKDEITIWLNGGPGCSSLEGFIQENALWDHFCGSTERSSQSRTHTPGRVSFARPEELTNMVWIEQPVGTGFSQGVSTETDEVQVAASFLGFWENFMDTFDLKGKKVYIAGESYAGQYIPWIADAMFNKEDKEFFDLQATMIYDPSVSGDLLLEDIPAYAYVEEYSSLFNLNDTTMSELKDRADRCGYTKFMEEYLTFPPKGPMPNIPLSTKTVPNECQIWESIFEAVLLTNPCFDVYSISTTCPLLWDILGYPGSMPYVPEGASVYFNRTDVQKAINAPIQSWDTCANVALGDGDGSLPSGLSVLPSVIERSERTIIAHAQLDYVLLYNGTLMAIQNMTWGGKQGFQKAPETDLYVPYHEEASLSTIASSGFMGITHTERKLTWNEIYIAGHMVPQYAPTVAYRQMEFLLGRIESMSEVSPFTTQPNVAQPPEGLGAPIVKDAPSNATAASNSTKLTTEQLFGVLNPGGY